MNTLTQADLLALWEHGRTLHPLDQGVLALRAAFPESAESIADWPLGRRNRALADLRGNLFGPALRGWTRCRHCTQQLEFAVDARVLAESYAGDERVVAGERRFRLPTSRDLAAVLAEPDPAVAVRQMVMRCCVAEDAGDLAWSDEELDAVGASMAAADPLAEIRLHFDCPECGASFDDSLDLPTFLWTEIEGRAKHLLADVHALASAYGWSEQQILSLGAARRQIYLDMVRA
jgi:hypothetical protein